MTTESGSVHEDDTRDSKVIDHQLQPDRDHGLGLWGCVLAIVSTIVGGGIVGVPFCFYELGLWITLGLMATVGMLTTNQC